MPQMSPLSWLTLFFYFLLTFLLINLMNYFIFNYPPKMKNIKKEKIMLNWKW